MERAAKRGKGNQGQAVPRACKKQAGGGGSKMGSLQRLREAADSMGWSVGETLTRTGGSDHSPSFRCDLRLCGRAVASEAGGSKQDAKERAATSALNTITSEPTSPFADKVAEMGVPSAPCLGPGTRARAGSQGSHGVCPCRCSTGGVSCRPRSRGAACRALWWPVRLCISGSFRDGREEHFLFQRPQILCRSVGLRASAHAHLRTRTCARAQHAIDMCACMAIRQLGRRHCDGARA